MQDVVTIRRQVEALRHSKKHASMFVEEWKSMDIIARSTIRMHLAENVYFNMAKETTTFSLWEKLQVVYEQKSSSKMILIRLIPCEDERDRSNNLPNQYLQRGAI